eukprot:COSAG05_NODE_2183_length_3430_cov_84.123386_2_plen_56_part_00
MLASNYSARGYRIVLRGRSRFRHLLRFVYSRRGEGTIALDGGVLVGAWAACTTAG